MRDHVRLRSRIAMLAGLAMVPSLAATGCNPPPKPEKQADGGTPRPKVSVDSRPDRSTQMSPARLKYYKEKAAREGKSLREVVPEHFEVPEGEPGGPAVRPRPDKVKTIAEGKSAALHPTPDEGSPTATPVPKVSATPSAGNHEVDPALMGAFPGDPPFIDGYNPEEETCTSGNWCGDLESAGAISVIDASAETMNCPGRIGGVRRDGQSKIEGPKYEGLSDKPNMQGSFNEHGTELARADGKTDDICCYHWFEYCSGRPHLSDAGPITAEVIEDAEGWTHDAAAIEDLPAPVRSRIAAAWRDDALAEHASIASFARTTLELMSVGAPADLLAQCQRAGLDEVQHAQACFSLAAQYGVKVGPGPLPALGPRAAELARLAADTFAEGCAGETVAALVAERSARDCADPTLRATLLRIADDESRHAALAWATVRWAIETGGAAVAAAVHARASAIAPPRTHAPSADADATLLAAHGRLDARAHHEAVQDAWTEIIGPLLSALPA